MLGKRLALITLLAVGLAAACFVAGQRARVESRNKAVDLVVDYGEIEQLASATGMMTADVLREFKAAGVTGVAVTEETFSDAMGEGMVTPIGGQRYQVDSILGAQIAEHLDGLLPGRSAVTVAPPAQDVPTATLTVPQGMSPAYLETLPIGLPEDALRTVNDAGLETIARLVSFPDASPRAIDSELRDVKSRGIKKVIFLGDQVLGFKGAEGATALAFRRNGLIFGKVEFAKQKGEVKLAKKTPGNVVIVHSIAQNEMPNLDLPTIVDRFGKAVRERDVRICYVRMYYTASANLLGDNADYVRRVAQGIRSAGYTLKSSRPFEEVSVPRAIRAAVGIGVAAGAVLLILAIVELSTTATVLWTILALVTCVGLAIFGDMGRKIVALISALVFPTLAVLYAIRSAPDSPTHVRRPFLRALVRFLGAVGIVVAGGLLVVGLLSARSFMLRLDQFLGVKPAHLLPVLIIATLLIGTIAWKSDTWTAQKRRFARALSEIGQNPILIWEAAGIVAILGLVGFMVLRSGNDSGVGVSEVELKFRSILDQVLFVRPRTKEFLIGYPILLAGLAFAVRGRRQWAAPLIVIGTIGLVSALNTFCHIHTPLAISAWRIANGVVVGTILGAILYRLIRNMPGREKE